MIALLILAAYGTIGFFTTRNALARRKALFPNVPLDGFDLAAGVILAGAFWPIGWPTSFMAFPSLRSLRAEKTKRSWKRLNQWIDGLLNESQERS